MSGTVGNEGDKIHILTLLASEQTVNGADNNFDDIDILPLVESADVIRLCHFALVEDQVNSARMILYIEPVAYVFALAIYGQRFAVTDIVDEQRDQFLGELVGTVVVRAVRNDSRHAVGVVERAHKVVAACLGSTVGRVRVVLGCFHEEVFSVGLMSVCRGFGSERRRQSLGVSEFECAIDLVGRDMIEAFAFVLLRQALPVEFGSLQHTERTHDVRACEGERVFDRAIDMALGSQMNNAGDVLLLHESIDCIEVANIRAHKAVVGLVLYILEVSQIAGISELINIDNAIVGVLVYKQTYNVTSDESGSAGDNDGVHIIYDLTIYDWFIYFVIGLFSHSDNEAYLLEVVGAAVALSVA